MTSAKMTPSIMALHKKAEPKFTDWRGAKAYVSTISFFDMPSYFAENLCKTIPSKRGRRRLLDVGCGAGIVGMYCLLEGKADIVTFNDIQCHAIAESCANYLRHVERKRIAPDQAEFLTHCSFEEIPPEIVARQDLIVFNPPQIPERYLDRSLLLKIKSDPSMSYFRLGGTDGLKVVRRFFQWYRGLGKMKPMAIIQLSSFIGVSLIERTIRQHQLQYEIELSTPLPLRPMFWAAAKELSPNQLTERGANQGNNGKWTKRLLTIFLR